MSLEPWACLRAARAHDPAQRVPFWIGSPTASVRVGSVSRLHLDAIADAAATETDTETDTSGDAAWCIGDDSVRLLAAPAQRDALLDRVNRKLARVGQVRGWRDERYALIERWGAPPHALIERAAARFWGSLCTAAHANGYVADAAGQPTHVWIARRALDKPTDPGRLDNLIGGGVPHGQTPFEALVREGWEEAGLRADCVSRAVAGSVLELKRDVAEGLQHEILFSYDLALPPGLTPRNQDGEVAELRCVPMAEALVIARSGEMTVDAELVTLDFALRHRLVDVDELGGNSLPRLQLMPIQQQIF